MVGSMNPGESSVSTARCPYLMSPALPVHTFWPICWEMAGWLATRCRRSLARETTVNPIAGPGCDAFMDGPLRGGMAQKTPLSFLITKGLELIGTLSQMLLGIE